MKEVKERSGTGLTFGTVASSADSPSSPRASSRDGDDDGGGFLGDGVGSDRAGASSSAASSSTPSGNRPSGRSPRSSSSSSRGASAAEEVMPASGQSSGNKLTVSSPFFPFRSGGGEGAEPRREAATLDPARRRAGSTRDTRSRLRSRLAPSLLRRCLPRAALGPVASRRKLEDSSELQDDRKELSRAESSLGRGKRTSFGG